MRKTINIPADPRDKSNRLPLITSEMKAACIGEFSWTEDAPYYDEDGRLIQHQAEHVVPWSLCKQIYRRMVWVAAGRYTS